MAYDVLITNEAFADLDAITGFIIQESSLETARKWFAAIIAAIDTLREMPGRCPLIPESEELGAEVRLLLHGRKHRAYKIYFSIHHQAESTGSVRVFHIRHWARKPVDADELEDLMEADE